MEKLTGILIADLSGYTALTEAHGSHAAADMIDRYLVLVNRSLVGKCRLQERTGDEVMIVSDDPAELLATARMLLQNTRQEEEFLLLHGGLHYGALLERNGSYFGSALNLAARVASLATPGSIWCTAEFVDAVETGSDQFVDRGVHSLKNMVVEKQLFEIHAGSTHAFFIDPVCRMLIHSTSSSWSHDALPDVYFCSEACMKNYLLPDKAERTTSK
jgi:adenylate cyclase